MNIFEAEFEAANIKFLCGDGINDDELNTLLLYYKNTYGLVEMLGTEFNLFKSEIRRRLYRLEDFERSRNANRGSI